MNVRKLWIKIGFVVWYNIYIFVLLIIFIDYWIRKLVYNKFYICILVYGFNNKFVLIKVFYVWKMLKKLKISGRN